MAHGGILGQTSSGVKRVCRLVVGTSTSGWTANDCDYLCDGTADNVEINAAIQALPSTGGEIIILDGTYNITATIAMSKDNVKLSGNGMATILQRRYNDSTAAGGLITITAINGGCCVENLQIDGNKTTYTSGVNCGITLYNSDNNIIIGNTCSNDTYYGINLVNSNNNTITGNTCNNNNLLGISLSGDDNTVTGNTYNNNNRIGISLSGDGNTVIGNTCNNNGNDGINLSNSNNNTITGNTYNNNSRYGINLSNSDNNAITGNTCNNNRYGINLSNSDNNAITGNTCIRGTGQSSDYTSSQYTIYLSGTGNDYNLIANNNIMGKNYTSGGGISNTFINNKYN